MNAELLNIIKNAIPNFKENEVSFDNESLLYNGIYFEFTNTNDVKLYFYTNGVKKVWRAVREKTPNFLVKINEKFDELLAEKRVSDFIKQNEEQLQVEFNNKLQNIQSQVKTNRITFKKSFQTDFFSVNITNVTESEALKVAEILGELKQTF